MKLNNNDDSHNSGLNLLIYNMLLDIESHPAWVCGLKPSEHAGGRWRRSHTLRGCVDWNRQWWTRPAYPCVTPCVGVWIETGHTLNYSCGAESHPAWVCGLKLTRWLLNSVLKVTPCVGVWIETSGLEAHRGVWAVTPCVGVWIETCYRIPPALERSHTLRGCVDWN